LSARRVLMVAYLFPPLGGVGVVRTLKFVKYLPDAGWMPVVLAPKNPAYWLRDPGSLREVPSGVEIVRSSLLEPTRVRRLLGGSFRAAVQPLRRNRGNGDATEKQRFAPGAGKVGRVWAHAVRWLFFPDEQITWLPTAVSAGVRIQRDRPVEVIYSSSPPISTHLIAGRIKARTGLPWVADFRDPWKGNAFMPALPAFQRPLQSRTERWIVEHADRCIFPTPSITSTYQQRYPAQSGRFLTIPNGYDPADVDPADLAAGPAPGTTGDKFRLLYTGSLHTQRELLIFLQGMELLAKRRKNVRQRLEVEFVSWRDEYNERVAAEFSTPTRLDGMVRFTDYVPHRAAIAKLNAADAGLVLLAEGPHRRGVVGTKIFEYIGLDKPVLAVIPPGDARAILGELDWGVIADPTPEGVAAGLTRMLELPLVQRKADPEGRYDRRNLAAKLAAVFEVVAPRASGE